MNSNINSDIPTALPQGIEVAAPQSQGTVGTVSMESRLASRCLHHGPGLQSLQHHVITQVVAIVINSVCYCSRINKHTSCLCVRIFITIAILIY